MLAISPFFCWGHFLLLTALPVALRGMSARRIKKLPRRAGQQPQQESGPLQGESRFVDLGFEHRTEEDRRERQELAREERLQALRESQRLQAPEAKELREASDEDEAIAAAEAVEVELFEGDREGHRIFSTPVQEKIATANARRIRWVEHSGKLTVAAVLLLTVVLAIVYVGRSGSGTDDIMVEPDEAELLKLEYASYLSNAKSVARKFMLADSMVERLQYVRYPDKIAEQMLKDQSTDWDAPLPFDQVHELATPIFKEPYFLGCYFQDEMGTYPVEVEIRPDGFFIDWEAFTAYNEVPWPEVLEERSTSKDYSMRVVAELSDYYNYQFTEDKYTSLYLQDRRRQHSMYAYAIKGSWVETELRKHLHETVLLDGTGAAMMTMLQLNIRFPEESTPQPMAEITALVSPDWYTLPPEMEDGRGMVRPGQCWVRACPVNVQGRAKRDAGASSQTIAFQIMRPTGERTRFHSHAFAFTLKE